MNFMENTGLYALLQEQQIVRAGDFERRRNLRGTSPPELCYIIESTDVATCPEVERKYNGIVLMISSATCIYLILESFEFYFAFS